MAGGDIHTEPHGARWATTVEGDPHPVNLHDTRLMAVKLGRELARQRRVGHYVHNQDGTISEGRR